MSSHVSLRQSGPCDFSDRFVISAHSSQILAKCLLSSKHKGSNTPGRKVEVGNFLIPKFKISFAFQVSDVLKDLGLISPFICMKDFTEMVDDPLGEDLYISGIYHKSIIEVNEEGTEAAAATGAVVTLQCRVKRRMIDFVADHPFLFVVRENVSGVILFIGNVLNPLVEG
ncbi:unnamed protein product [Rhodiola kirilowii]